MNHDQPSLSRMVKLGCVLLVVAVLAPQLAYVHGRGDVASLGQQHIDVHVGGFDLGQVELVLTVSQPDDLALMLFKEGVRRRSHSGPNMIVVIVNHYDAVVVQRGQRKLKVAQCAFKRVAAVD